MEIIKNRGVKNEGYKEHIACFLDILGYGELVKKYENNFDKVLELKRGLENVTIFHDLLREIPKEFSRSIYNKTYVHVLSDSILITMPLSNLKKIYEEYSEEENLLYYVLAYLIFVSEVYKIVASKIGCLSRGAIVKGLHFIDKLSNSDNKFIFSPALIKAFQLEEEAVYPRIIIDDSVYSLVKDAVVDKSKPIYEQLLKHVTFIDHTGVRCLDIFSGLSEKTGENISQEIWQVLDIRSKVTEQMNNNRTNADIIAKYHYFTEYFNSKLRDEQKNHYSIRLDGKIRDMTEDI